MYMMKKEWIKPLENIAYEWVLAILFKSNPQFVKSNH